MTKKQSAHPAPPVLGVATPPSVAPQLLDRARQLLRSRQASQAAALCLQAARLEPRHASAWQLLGQAQLADQQASAAVSALRHALTLDPGNTQTLSLLATALAHNRQAGEAMALADQAVAADAGNAGLWHSHGHVLRLLGRPELALVSFDRALALAPQHADSWRDRGHALRLLHRLEEAVASFERATQADTQRAELWWVLGRAQEEMQRLPQALASYERTVQLEPAHVHGQMGVAGALQQMGQHEQALRHFEQAARQAPESPALLLGRAQSLHALQRDAQALAALQQAHALRPADPGITQWLLHLKLLTAHWSGLPALLSQSLDALRSGPARTSHLTLLAHPDVGADDLLRANRAYVSALVARVPGLPRSPSPNTAAARRLRLAYLSSDLRRHPVSFLMAGVFEAHDRTRFETFAFSTYPLADASAERQRAQAAFEHFIDIHALGDDDAARLIAQHQIDILIDLNGLTTFCRPGIVARRPAPVQVHYLGYPGTSGLAAVDYILGDRWVTPRQQADAYCEHIVHLPDSFQANDDQRRIAPETPSRTTLGLPEQGFVFCCLNNTYKILPAVFDTWMRLLRKTPGSVLWLLGDGDTARDHLRAQAQVRGVAAERLVFAQRRPYEQYLAQYRQADLFLDTLPFNGGTTVSDALWAGLPVLTQAGQRFAGRMAASLLDAVGLPELITHTADEYEALALRLATEPGRLQGFRDRLAANRPSAALFDTRRFTRHLERALAHMAWRHAQGLAPQGFDVASLPAHPMPAA